MSDDRDDGIIDLSRIRETLRDDESPPVVIKKRRYYGTCQHRQVSVDEMLRRVLCVVCGETLDPVEVLLEYARGFRLAAFKGERLRRLEEEHREREEKKQQAHAARVIGAFLRRAGKL